MISRIGHVGLRVVDLDRSVNFAQTILGLRETERIGSVSYLTCNERHHELVVIGNGETGCDHLGLEVADMAALDVALARVKLEGFAVIGERTDEQGVEAAFRFIGPGGVVFEIFCGMSAHQPAADLSDGVRPRKFEHITIKSSDKPAMEDLLIRVLGLRLSDRAGDRVSWLRASGEHHGMSVMADDVDALQHYAWQISSFAQIKEIGDHLMRNGVTFLWGPGHHGIGDNYFCYFLDADGVIVEYSAEIQIIDDEDAWTPTTWPDVPLSVNRWGNPPPPQEFIDGGVPMLPPLPSLTV
jgi:catechol 2,3-dioxygenase-like lactoylglutathione lyase family enzyme